MSSALSKKQLISLLILLGLIFVLPFSLLLTKQRQEVRKKAASLTGPLQLTLTPSSVAKNKGDIFTYSIKINNASSSAVQVRVAGVELKVNPIIDDFNITQIKCGSTLTSAAFADIFESRVRLVCYKTPGTPNDPLTIAAGSSFELGSFQVEIKNTAAGSYVFSSREADGGRNNIPQETTLADLSDLGAKASLTISGTATNPPVSTSTPVLTNTPVPGCSKGGLGDLTCDGAINMLDLTLFLASWSPNGPAPTPASGKHIADIAPPDSPDNKVNILDLNRLLGNWGQ